MAVAPGIEIVDTMFAGMSGIIAAYVIPGERPTLVDTGPQTAAATVRDALAAHGIGPDDLAQIVLTHIHLDHCGASGELVEWFPRATVLVHERGARHLIQPGRLLESSFAVYGDLAHLYGGLTPIDEDRIRVIGDGDRVDLGGGRSLEVIDAPGHARHQVALFDDDAGVMLAADALGVCFQGSSLYPTVPPPEFDLAAGLTTLAALERRGPAHLLLPHFGPLSGDVPEALAVAADRQRALAHAAAAGWRRAGAAGVERAIAEQLPLEAVVGDPGGLERWRLAEWADNNVAGLARWAMKQAEAEAAGETTVRPPG